MIFPTKHETGQLNKHGIGKACAFGCVRVGSDWPTRRVWRGATCAAATLAGTNIGFVVYLSGQPARGFQMGLRHFRSGGLLPMDSKYEEKNLANTKINYGSRTVI